MFFADMSCWEMEREDVKLEKNVYKKNLFTYIL